MSEMLQPIPEIMLRTLRNLKLVDELKENRAAQGIDVDTEGPFEVTQLVNSFLGALAMPWEALLKERSPEQFSGLQRLERHLQNAQTLEAPEPNLVQQLGLIRNGFLHGNIEFQARATRDGGSEISGIRLWNCRRRGNAYRKTWEIRLSVEQMSELLHDFSHLANEIYDERLIRRREDCVFANSLPEQIQ